METTNIPITQWSEDDRPREKMILKGKSALTDAELVAILIGSGTRSESAVTLCRKILSNAGNDLNVLGKMSVSQLMKFRGIGQAKALSIAAALELGRRRRASEAPEPKKITSSRSVFELMHPLLGDLPHEEFWILYLNNSNRVLNKAQLSKGGITGTVVDIRIAFRGALELNATGIILVHNHPSGTLQASDADRQITKKIRAAGENLDIKVLDHVIVTERGYMSFADEGMI